MRWSLEAFSELRFAPGTRSTTLAQWSRICPSSSNRSRSPQTRTPWFASALPMYHSTHHHRIRRRRRGRAEIMGTKDLIGIVLSKVAGPAGGGA